MPGVSVTPYTYCFVRKDMPLFAQLVQSAHACHELGMSLPRDKVPINSHLILLQVRNEDELLCIDWQLRKKRIRTVVFYEPDHYDGKPLGNSALCTEPLYGTSRNFFNKFELWTHGE